MFFIDFEDSYLCPDFLGCFCDFCSIKPSLHFLALLPTLWVVGITSGYAVDLD